MRTGHGVIVGLEGHLQMMVYLAEFLRPGHGLGAASAGIDAQKIVVRVLPQIDVGGQAGMRCGLLPVRDALGNLRGLVAIVTIERRSYLHAQRAQFAREILAQAHQGVLQARLHLRFGGGAHLQAPAILQHRQHDQHGGQQGHGEPYEETVLANVLHVLSINLFRSTSSGQPHRAQTRPATPG